MRDSRRHRCPRRLRLFALLLIAVGLVFQPVLAAAGEIHEFSHDPSGSHAHDVHADSGAASDLADDTAGSATLHVLLHFAHCCGANTALPLDASLTGSMVHPAKVFDALFRMAPQAPVPAPFKPPIDA